MSLRYLGTAVEMAPRLLREDVARHRGGDARVGFDLTINGLGGLMYHPGAPGLELGPDTDPVPLLLPRRPGAALLLRFLADVIRASPSGVLWLLTRDPRHKAAIKEYLGLSGHLPSQLARVEFLPKASRPAVPREPGPVTIVVPVYNAFDLLPDTLNRLIAHTDVEAQLLVIEDKSTDPRVLPFLRGWLETVPPDWTGRVELIENRKNRGFIGSVNKGLARAVERGGHAILVNSDALVPAGWASRLLAPFGAAASVATVTPFSNDAEIFTVPIICQRNTVTSAQVDEIDAVARSVDGQAALLEVPTGVGFCMAISASWLARIPSLDDVFGRGYGEEVDWCQRARSMGGIHVVAPDLFVGHVGGESFGAEAKAGLVAANHRIIQDRYPTYDAEVQSFIQNDPLSTARLLVALGWIGRDATLPVSVYVAHWMGGGAEYYLQDRIAQDGAAVVLRVGGPHRVQIELWSGAAKTAIATNDLAFVTRAIALLPRRKVVYNCAVGDPSPVDIPTFLLGLVSREQDELQILFHDFFPISPSYNLLDSDGAYRGTPLGASSTDPAHATKDASGKTISLLDWQGGWGRVMEAATEIVTFSDDSTRHVAAVWPEIADKIHCRPHALRHPVPRIERPEPKGRTIAVIGNIGLQKGAGLIAPLSAVLAAQDVRLVVIGNVDPSFAIPSRVKVHGQYEVQDLPDLVQRYGITGWLVPSIWPETFSYTTHEALATGLPVYAFAIGAQGAAVAKADNGRPVEFGPVGELASRLADAILS
ncbi:glycosyltransferase [Loktanella sp. IMCC34160]|uniref:glycosyltransferase n=1 Tax=Loktanella sp. IMCC34160 TaxID=2510646 RepID=UPI0010EFEE4F|nr:glycosyltransferase [Loktanella sp. IMCC34160]RYG90484.1 glycosyltransferase [Loktanella sp. IMCC34160]